MRIQALIFFSLISAAFGQNASDYENKPVRELQEKPSQARHKADRVAVQDHATDSLFQAIEQDSIARQREKDSLASVSAQTQETKTETAKNLAAAHMAADSMASLVEADSGALHPVETGFFRGLLKCSGKIDVDKRVECLEYCIKHKQRSAKDMLDYLALLQKYCTDKCEMIRDARAILPDEQKFKAMAAFRHAQEDCAKVQDITTRIPLNKEVSGSQ